MGDSSPNHSFSGTSSGYPQYDGTYMESSEVGLSLVGTGPGHSPEDFPSLGYSVHRPVRHPRKQEIQGSLGDDLSMAGSGAFVYAFPLIPLIPRLLRKLKTEPCTMILIAPAWPRQVWITELLLLSQDHLLHLRHIPFLLTMFQGRWYIQSSLQLTAWLLNTESIRI